MTTRDEIANNIIGIMNVYYEQEKRGHVGSPGGLEHMGDVWNWFKFWDKKLREEAANV